MRVVHVNDYHQREACLARLCAEAFGTQAGLTPLLRFAGVTGVLFDQQAARVLALVDKNARPVALALLVLDQAGEGMTPVLTADLDDTTIQQPSLMLIRELSGHAPLRVEVTANNAADSHGKGGLEKDYHRVGITRWFTGAQGQRLGLSRQHPAASGNQIQPPLSVDDEAIALGFKQDRALFDTYKQRFIDALAAFPETL
ncbi:hypothetical protein [Halomonas halocynthiae]|uniref:hypothetical protein n=1 Tax=Halomonas halocynthiae TaxID=176290 RepID=UPI0004036C72|nr:hypothetical protein [Halomonas halocynthiae]